jgi:hypothetical protein
MITSLVNRIHACYIKKNIICYMEINIHNFVHRRSFLEKTNRIFCLTVFMFKLIQNMIEIVMKKLFHKTIPVYEYQKSPS